MFEAGLMLGEVYSLKMAAERRQAMLRETEVEWLLRSGQLRPVRPRRAWVRRLAARVGERLVVWGTLPEARVGCPATAGAAPAPSCLATGI